MRQWRLIYDPPTSGARNMAVDEAIMGAVARGEMPPTLRLYDWSPACLSLGYGQKTGDVDFERLARMGWQAVRRPTGGRAILHTDELTYSIALPEDHPIAAGGIVESYRRISAALLRALADLGAPVAADRRDDSPKLTGPVCFEVPSHYEITFDGRKLLGSAQTRRRGGVLQHGTLPLSGNVSRICDALVYPDEAARAAAKEAVHQRATTLQEALGGQVISWHDAAEAVARAFAETFKVQLLETGLTSAESEAADQLEATVYASVERRRLAE